MSGSVRSAIVNKLVEVIKTIDGTQAMPAMNGNPAVEGFNSNLYSNVINRMVFLDEVTDFPYVSVTTESETRQYLPGAFKWAFLDIIIRVYANSEDAESDLQDVMSDIETLLDKSNDLIVVDAVAEDIGTGQVAITEQKLEEISITRIDFDGGVLAPSAFGEIRLTCRYEVKT